MWGSGDDESGSIPGDSEKFFNFLKTISIPGEDILFYNFQLDLSEKVKQDVDTKLYYINEGMKI